MTCHVFTFTSSGAYHHAARCQLATQCASLTKWAPSTMNAINVLLAWPLQIAKAHGAHVTTTCSTRNVEYVTKELGADVAIDYTKVSCSCLAVIAMG